MGGALQQVWAFLFVVGGAYIVLGWGEKGRNERESTAKMSRFRIKRTAAAADVFKVGHISVNQLLLSFRGENSPFLHFQGLDQHRKFQLW